MAALSLPTHRTAEATRLSTPPPIPARAGRCKLGLNTYTCDCPVPFSGLQCQTRSFVPVPNCPAAGVTCFNEGGCPDPGSKRCKCEEAPNDGITAFRRAAGAAPCRRLRAWARKPRYNRHISYPRQTLTLLDNGLRFCNFAGGSSATSM